MIVEFALATHPTVTWDVSELKDGHWRVLITCPVCGEGRFQPTRTVRHRVRLGKFTGICRADWHGQRNSQNIPARPTTLPVHPAVNWEAQQRGPRGIFVQVRCSGCDAPRFESARSVRYRIARGTFSGQCRFHTSTNASQQARSDGMVPSHAAVHWDVTERRRGECWVEVACPHCGILRFELAKSVRYRLRRGTYTGLCRTDARKGRVSELEPVAFPGTRATVSVTCPICGEERLVSGASVRRQLKQGTFTGRCMRDRLIGSLRATREKPANPWIDWHDREIVNEGPNRRRTMVRVHCPQCGEVRLSHAGLLERAVRNGTFYPECVLHRKQRPLGLDIEPGPEKAALRRA